MTNQRRSCAVRLLMAAIGLAAAAAGLAATAENPALTGAVDEQQVQKFLASIEKIDIDQMLNNQRLMTNNVKCLLDEGPCSAQLREMKKIIPMLVKDSCSMCNKDQKKKVKKAIDTMKSLRSSDYEKLAKFFDPDGRYTKKFMENLEA